MSMYNLLFGSNPAADVILATLGLTKDDVGRFRDCFIADGEIAVYTRNGGGNRECWHSEGEGNSDCKGEAFQREEDEYAEINDGGLITFKKTGKRVMKTRRTCAEPCSEHCGCPGCIINFRLPKHPNYLRDQDDDFDCTYATIYFSFPEQYAEGLRAIDSGEKFDPDARWDAMLAAIGAGAKKEAR